MINQCGSCQRGEPPRFNTLQSTSWFKQHHHFVPTAVTLSHVRASDPSSCTLNTAMKIKLKRQRPRGKIQGNACAQKPRSSQQLLLAHGSKARCATSILRKAAPCTKTSQYKTQCNTFQGPVTPLEHLSMSCNIDEHFDAERYQKHQNWLPMELLLVCASAEPGR